MKGEDLGVKTWPPGHWENGGGTVWGWISYGPELDLIFYVIRRYLLTLD
jgi:lanthanide-dependent methanol dehydrogenase